MLVNTIQNIEADNRKVCVSDPPSLEPESRKSYTLPPQASIFNPLTEETSFRNAENPQSSESPQHEISKRIKQSTQEPITREGNKNGIQTLLERLNQSDGHCPQIQSQLWSVQLVNNQNSKGLKTTHKPRTRSRHSRSRPITYRYHCRNRSKSKRAYKVPKGCKTIPGLCRSVTMIGHTPLADSLSMPEYIYEDEISLTDEALPPHLKLRRRKTVEVVVPMPSPEWQRISSKSPQNQEAFISNALVKTRNTTLEVIIPIRAKIRERERKIPKDKGKIVKIMEQTRSQSGKILYRVFWEDGHQSWESPRDMNNTLDLVETFEHAQFRRFRRSGYPKSIGRYSSNRQYLSKHPLIDTSISAFEESTLQNYNKG
ncbi:hypothetical protein K7432_008968 [Basidiobolus ranarum]|uniref:Chromo domain-containing protein n=1 Tax=Basidiobolus ranarum TaxID=34480 RepID=A0ABR2VXS1_9FUNG